ncbi:HigA family addiction module antitoxin [Oryzomicrobium sp.]|uniref:HigA family addiction module antitoxin n=1 Tax=Oryzomicrobium sp. TaxID=1911578 RepID=UPI0026002FBC|nr:HigA family addiction module antitoxin [Oryzomicrobium sp.]
MVRPSPARQSSGDPAPGLARPGRSTGTPLLLRRPFSPGRAPAHPGHFLHTRFMRPLGLSQDSLARTLGISRRRLNEIIVGRRAISADTALRLALHFGQDARFWLHLQLEWDLYQAWKHRHRPVVES